MEECGNILNINNVKVMTLYVFHKWFSFHSDGNNHNND